MKKVSIKASKIKVVLTDVDGVLTDGGMYYSTKGEKISCSRWDGCYFIKKK